MGYIEYIKKYSKGKHLSEANDSIEYKSATQANTVSAYKKYLTNYLDGRHNNEARKHLEKLLNDDTFYQDAVKIGTRKAYEEFLELFPGHMREFDIRAHLQEQDYVIEGVIKRFLHMRLSERHALTAFDQVQQFNIEDEISNNLGTTVELLTEDANYHLIFNKSTICSEGVLYPEITYRVKGKISSLPLDQRWGHGDVHVTMRIDVDQVKDY